MLAKEKEKKKKNSVIKFARQDKITQNNLP